MDHCGCIIEDNHCQKAIHAEVNAILFANTSLKNTTLYINKITGVSPVEKPCRECMKVVKASGISRIVCRVGDGMEVMWL